MLARTPWTEIYLRTAQQASDARLRVKLANQKPKPPLRKLNRERYRHLVTTVAAILRTGEPTAFSFEAACRQSLRSRLCMKGWAWADADAVAADIVASALHSIGAKRPTWQQGQPEYTQDGHAPIARIRCVRCGRTLPEGHTRFCGLECRRAHGLTMMRLRNAEEARAYDLVARGSRWLAQPCD